MHCKAKFSCPRRNGKHLLNLNLLSQLANVFDHKREHENTDRDTIFELQIPFVSLCTNHLQCK